MSLARTEGLRRPEVALAALATLLVSAVRWAIARKVTFCGTPDSCTYLALAESLSRHHGFSENFLYQYQFVSAHVPSPGIEYWRPGTSFFLLLAQPFGGVTLHASLLITMLAGIALCLAAWRAAMLFSGDRRLACASYLLCLVLPPLWVGSLSPDSSLFYGAAAAWFLVLFRVRGSTRGEDVLGLGCVALVSLIRNDAVLLVFPLLAVLYLRRRAGLRGSRAAYIAAMLAGFAAANALMPLLDYVVLGRAFPAGALGAMYLNSLDELSNYGAPATLKTLLSHGAGALLRLRVQVLPTILYRVAVLVAGFGIVLIPEVWLRGRGAGRPARPELAGGAVFLLAVIAVYSLALPAVGAFSALRSCLGLLPLASVLMVCGARGLAAGERQARWLIGGVTLFYAVIGVTAAGRSRDEMNAGGDHLRQAAAALRAAGGVAGTTLVMTSDAPQFTETTGFWSVPIPANGPPAIEAAVHDLGPRFLLIDEQRLAAEPALRAALHPLAEMRIPAAHLVLLRLR